MIESPPTVTRVCRLVSAGLVFWAGNRGAVARTSASIWIVVSSRFIISPSVSRVSRQGEIVMAGTRERLGSKILHVLLPSIRCNHSILKQTTHQHQRAPTKL